MFAHCISVRCVLAEAVLPDSFVSAFLSEEQRSKLEELMKHPHIHDHDFERMVARATVNDIAA